MAAYIADGTIENCEIVGSSDGIQAVGGATIRNNYIHQLAAFKADAHIDAIQLYGGATKTVITGNYIDCTDHSQWKIRPNGSVFAQGNFPMGIDVANNMLRGAGYLLRFESGVTGPSGVANNVFENGMPGNAPLPDGKPYLWGSHYIQGPGTRDGGANRWSDGRPIKVA
jgi:hypothetical protein